MAWAGGLGGFLLPHWMVLTVIAFGAVVLAARRRRGRPVVVTAAWLVAATAVAFSAMLRVEAVAHSALADLARQHAFVSATVRVTSDPVLKQGRFEPFTLTRASTVEVTGRGLTRAGHLPVLVIADRRWLGVELGSVVRVEGRATPSEGEDLAAVISSHRPPVTVSAAGPMFDGARTVRAAIRHAVSGAGPQERNLVPALVAGDDRGMPLALVADFQATGLTHLLAVSGTNLTLVVGFLLVIARWCGVRARGLIVVGVLGVAGFVLLARTEPSVLRAAAMGSVALIGMGSQGRERGVRALGVAVLLLLLLDPWLALSLGFVLSALATAGILFLAPPWRDALASWTPRWVAEAVAVPLAAQLVCTPVVAAISSQVSLVAVLANMAVAPVVGPATVLGLTGGLTALAVEPLGMLLGRGAGWCAWWITSVADHSANLPTAAVGWSSTWSGIVLLTALCLVAAWMMPGLLSRRRWAIPAALLMVLVVVRPLPTPGWPPAGWVLVACDVGQGDGLVLNAGRDRAVVVDVGPDPRAMDRCLDRLGVKRVPVVVLTHFHADHIDGLPAVLASRPPRRILVTSFDDPPYGAEEVRAWARAAHVPVRVPAVGEVRRFGPLTWQVLGPLGRFAAGYAEGEGSPANNASVVLLVETHGIRLLLSGDMEPEAQEAVHEAFPGLRVDVLKVPHHGSRYQDPGFLTSLGARVALISVGRDNTYGHPAPETLDLLRHSGMLVRRTDESGDLAVVVHDGQLAVRELRSSSWAIR